MWPFNRKQAIETRSSGSGYTAQIMAARASYISGSSGIGELTGTVQSCLALWEGAMAIADVEGNDLLDRHSLALAGRALALRGECVFLITETGLIPAFGSEEKFQKDPHFQNLYLFFEYFHGDVGAGLGAAHQTGWTGLVADLIEYLYAYQTEKVAVR